jgi:molecular chaperone GrpE
MSHLAILKTLTELARRLEDTEKQVKRLSKEQYKANTLTEAQSTQAQEMLEVLKGANTEEIQRARVEVASSLLPVLDSIESGIRSGLSQIKALHATAPEAAQTLSAWLEGQYLIRKRLLQTLEAEGIERIPTVGRTFDPELHFAVKAVQHPDRTNGIILAEERGGYRYNGTVLRYADVIVNKEVV